MTANLLRWAERALERLGMRLLRFVGLLLAGALVYAALGAIAQGLPPAVSGPALLIGGLPIGLLVRRLATDPDSTVIPLLRFGRLQPLFFVVAVWLAAAGWFSAVAVVLNDHASAEFVTRSGDASPVYGQFADFFAWQFAEQIPVLKVNETLHWEVPLSYEGGAGWLVLAFRVLVLIPLAQVALPALKRVARRGPAPAEAASG